MLAPFVFAMPVFLAALSTDVKFTESNTTVLGGRPLVSTRTRYVSGRRVRLEYRNVTGTMEGSVQYGPLIASVMQCDSGKAYEINFENREYAVGDLPRYPTLEEAKAKAAEPQAKLAAPETPIVVVERTTVRTGETLQMFGHTARHVITTKRYIPDKGAQHPASEQVRDGWYVDFDVRSDCIPDYIYSRRSVGIAVLTMRVAGQPNPPLDRYKLHQ